MLGLVFHFSVRVALIELILHSLILAMLILQSQLMSSPSSVRSLVLFDLACIRSDAVIQKTAEMF